MEKRKKEKKNKTKKLKSVENLLVKIVLHIVIKKLPVDV
jgi:hypothetical protein